MKVYTKTEMRIEWQEADALELSRVGNKVDTLLNYHRVREMISTKTGEVITSADLQTVACVIEALLRTDHWYVDTE